MVVCAAYQPSSSLMAPFLSSPVLANWRQSFRSSFIIKDAPTTKWEHCYFQTRIFLMKEHASLDSAQRPAATDDMDPEAFRRYGHQVVDWMANYLAEVGKYPVLAHIAPGDIRRSIPGLHIRQEGMSGRAEVPRLRYYASQEAHSSVDKAGIVLGIGQAGLRKIGVDSEFRMDVAELERTIQEDIAAGWRPFAVVATVGTTSTTRVHPVPQIADVCERHGLWLHVDGAYGGLAAVDPAMRRVLAGCERADTLIVNPHKWLFTPVDCSVFYTRKPDVVKAAFSLVPEYLRNTESKGDEVPNLMDYGTSLGRRFRSLKLWMIMRYFR